MNIIIRPALEQDRAFFIDVHHRAYQKTIEEQFGPWDEAVQDGFANKAFDEGGMNIIEINTSKVGVVGWEEFPDYLWLKEVFVLPKFQNHGIGSYILKLTDEKAKDAGKKQIKLQTLKANLKAKTLYERNGFNLFEETEIHWKLVKEI